MAEIHQSVNGINHKDTENGKEVNGVDINPFFVLCVFVSLWFNPSYLRIGAGPTRRLYFRRRAASTSEASVLSDFEPN
jgi:hypothetical protein